mmetsp:Transcript_39430/g.98696  ORF Transcript_39430/g.98696 Transcript_39430/m.98696 type:complete len:91 (-) Transcript_39430:77-349(-)
MQRNAQAGRQAPFKSTPLTSSSPVHNQTASKHRQTGRQVGNIQALTISNIESVDDRLAGCMCVCVGVGVVLSVWSWVIWGVSQITWLERG